jgi:outer membrane protein
MNYLITISIVLAGLTSKAQVLTLKECIETAIKNNLQIKQMEWAAETDKANWQLSRGNMVPFLSSGISHGLNQGRNIDPFTNSYVDEQVKFANYSINTSVILWNGSNLRNSAKRDELAYKAGQMDVQQAKDNVTINVILAYLQVLNNEELLTLAKQQTAVTRQQVERLDILNKQGAILPSIFYDLKGQLSGDEVNEVNARNTLENSRVTLSQLMNVQFNAAMQLEKVQAELPQALADQPQQIYETAAKQLAVVKAAQLRQQSAAKELLAARGNKLPSLFFSGGVGTNYSSAASTLLLAGTNDVQTNNYVLVGGDKTPVYSSQNKYTNQKISYFDQWKNNVNSSVSLGIKIPILNGAQARTRISLSKMNEKRAGFELQTAKTQLQQSVQQAYLNMTAAYERYTKLQQQVSDYSESFRSAEVRFKAGVGTSVDYILAKNNVDRATGNLVAAKYDYLLRTKVLDYYKGVALY